MSVLIRRVCFHGSLLQVAPAFRLSAPFDTDLWSGTHQMTLALLSCGDERTSSKSRRFLAGRWQIGGFDRRGYEQELFEGHLQLAKAALTENERVEFEHFVANRCRQCGRRLRARKRTRLANWIRAGGPDPRL